MKDEESPVSLPSPPAKKDASRPALFCGKNGYKFWALAAILLLAFWSMFTGSVSLKWSSGDLASSSDQPDFHITEDLDILEVEEREKTVRRMWDIYTHSTTVRLSRFWVEAFQAAYEYLVSDIPSVRDGAVSEIAKLSMRSFNPDTLPVSVQPMTGETRKTLKQVDKSREVTTPSKSS
ncbi:uncharacterized protein LOC110813478 isoform X2 [Carica papaya]|uniref:uncharacterized protein LOC110813478 isoform X2 n=1 Tax=Carica papaya TaxID=3649 RepID=UPI000B8CC3E5|nr:uncharacterized protein LOC110813478 isoform X2 [Carica papaya]